MNNSRSSTRPPPLLPDLANAQKKENEFIAHHTPPSPLPPPRRLRPGETLGAARGAAGSAWYDAASAPPPRAQIRERRAAGSAARDPRQPASTLAWLDPEASCWWVSWSPGCLRLAGSGKCF